MAAGSNSSNNDSSNTNDNNYYHCIIGIVYIRNSKYHGVFRLLVFTNANIIIIIITIIMEILATFACPYVLEAAFRLKQQ